MRKVVNFCCLLTLTFLLGACGIFQKSAILEQVGDYRSVGDKMQDCADGFLREEIGVPAIDSFRTKAKITISHASKNLSFDSVIVFERPDRARLEFLKPGLQQIESIMTISDDNVTAYSTSNQTVFQGKANYTSIYRLFGIPLTEEELMSWFVGRLLIKENYQLLEVKRSSLLPGRMYLLYDMHDGRKARILLDGAKAECDYPNFRIREIEILARSNEKTLFYTVYGYNDDEMVPAEIKFKIHEVSADGLIIIANKYEINAPLKKYGNKLFKINYPEHAIIKDISEMDKNDMLFKP
ncbi:MAG: DUF4292 domain-containing protein [Deltaproteobacteria bacterium]|jgi:hypothetical protein|nr:DUF4292 domain-containing protein [Deltaproteobacteria bacterium]